MNKRTYFIKTFGCQANIADSERIENYLLSVGLTPVKEYKKAAWVIINSCSVRQSAENRVYGLVNNLQKLRINELTNLRIILTGCMLYHPIRYLKKRLTGVDYFVRTPDWPKFIKAHFDTSQYRSGNNIPVAEYKGYTLVPIMEGCNNFCTYCVVPYARGREQSRPMKEIINEVKNLVKRGHRKILLLGQNVNSYNSKLKIKSQKLKVKAPFAKLLVGLNKINGVERIAFLSSNPWDFTDDIIEAMTLPKIAHHLHLPVQSGDKKILRRMNRKYTPLQYIELVDRIKKKIPDIRISTDIIVGFPGETKKQFQHTVDLCRKIGFYQAFINKYSPRPGTAAYKMEDNVPIIEKKRRWRILDNLINRDRVKI